MNEKCWNCGQDMPDTKDHELQIYLSSKATVEFKAGKDFTGRVFTTDSGTFHEWAEIFSDEKREAMLWCNQCDEDLVTKKQLKKHGVRLDWAETNGWKKADPL